MVYIRGLGYIGSPQDLLRNEWTMFVVIFLLSFSVVYIALANFFHRKKKMTPLERLMGANSKEMTVARGPLVVIAACVAAMISASFSRYDFMTSYLGAGVAYGVLVFSIVVFIILSLPFYKALEANTGAIIGVPLYLAIIWFVLKYFVPYYTFSNISYELQRWYETVTTGGFLIILLIVGVISGIIRSATLKKSR